MPQHWTEADLLATMSADCRRLNAARLGLGAQLAHGRQNPVVPAVLTIDLYGTATAPPGLRRLTFSRFRLESEANRHEHWTKKAARAKEQRSTVYYNLRCTYWPLPTLPCTITLTRIAPRALDEDNKVSCFKAVQDGVADWLAGAEGKGQDRIEGLTWAYAQQRGKPREYGLWIEIQEGTHVHAPDPGSEPCPGPEPPGVV